MLSRRSDWMHIANLLIKLSWLPLCRTQIVPGSTDKKIKIIENSQAIEHSLMYSTEMSTGIILQLFA
jgi:hypothetical protein